MQTTAGYTLVRAPGAWAAKPMPAALFYLVAITAAELVTVLGDARVGIVGHLVILFVLVGHATFVVAYPLHRMLLALTLAPLIRVLSLAMPLQDVELVYWYVIIGFPLMVAVALTAEALDLKPADLGLTMKRLPLQVIVAMSAVIFAVVEYAILEPEPLIDRFTWQAAIVPTLILLVGTGFTEEVVFRGLMQRTTREIWPRFTIWFPAAVFAALHIGYKSPIDVAFVFAVGAFYGLVVQRTGSLLGVTLSHGLSNVLIFLVLPFTILADRLDDTPAPIHLVAAQPSGAVAASAPARPQPVALRSLTPIFAAEEPHDVTPVASALSSAVSVPLVEPPALFVEPLEPLAPLAPLAPPASFVPPPASSVAPLAPPPAGVPRFHTVRPGDTVSGIAAQFGTTVESITLLNALGDVNRIEAGKLLVLPPR